jgi:hypothetical protein
VHTSLDGAQPAGRAAAGGAPSCRGAGAAMRRCAAVLAAFLLSAPMARAARDLDDERLIGWKGETHRCAPGAARARANTRPFC